MPRARVTVESRFPQYERHLDRAIGRGLGWGAASVVAASRAVPSRYDIGEIKAKIRAYPAERFQGFRSGWVVYVASTDWRAYWFEKGTYAKRGARRSARGADVQGNRGVQPQRFMRTGLRAAWASGIKSLERAMRW
jgi:hypothetical protein